MSAHGSRITDGGYQAPRTDAAALKRGRAIKTARWVIGTVQVSLELVPFTGGRPDLYELALQTNDRVIGHSVYIPCMLRGRELAQRAFELTAQELDLGVIPGAVILPPGAPLGW